MGIGVSFNDCKFRKVPINEKVEIGDTLRLIDESKPTAHYVKAKPQTKDICINVVTKVYPDGDIDVAWVYTD